MKGSRRGLAIGLVVASAAAAWGLLPPRPLATPPAAWVPARPTVRGAYHVHTARSDGSGTWQHAAEAAARAGLDFIIFTDHGNGTERREPPRYHAGVLCLDGVEISTWAGHYVAITAEAVPAPYPLAGEPEAVVEDVRRYLGPAVVGVVAHPDSRREALRWREWDVPFDGLEWLNADSEWRDEGIRLARALFTYPLRPVETLAAMIGRPSATLERWEALTAVRSVVALAGHDAHARLGLGGGDPYGGPALLRVPSYEASFRAFSNHVMLERPLTGDAAVDARLLVAALGRGAAYTTIDGLAPPGPFAFEAEAGLARAGPGERLRAPFAEISLRARTAAPTGSRMVLWRGGEAVAESTSGEMVARVRASGAYRIEVYVPRDAERRIPWLLSNPIYVDTDDRYEPTSASTFVPRTSARSGALDDPSAWAVEHSADSRLALEPAGTGGDGRAVRLRYALGGGTPAGQYVALRLPVPADLASWSHLRVTATSDTPVRVWVQLRRRAGRAGERWGRSVAVMPTGDAAWLPLTRFRPIGTVSTPTPPLDAIDDLLIVVDTVNTAPGTAGAITVRDVELGR